MINQTVYGSFSTEASAALWLQDKILNWNNDKKGIVSAPWAGPDARTFRKLDSSGPSCTGPLIYFAAKTLIAHTIRQYTF